MIILVAIFCVHYVVVFFVCYVFQSKLLLHFVTDTQDVYLYTYVHSHSYTHKHTDTDMAYKHSHTRLHNFYANYCVIFNTFLFCFIYLYVCVVLSLSFFKLLPLFLAQHVVHQNMVRCHDFTLPHLYLRLSAQHNLTSASGFYSK